MRVLTNGECRRWVKSQGLIYQPFRQNAVMAGQFKIDDAVDGSNAALRAVLSVSERAGQTLVVIEDHPMTYDDRRTRLIEFRTSCGENRSIESAPGHLVNPKTDDILANLLRICIGPGSWWSTYVYLAPIKSSILIWESSLIDLWSDRNSDYHLLERELPPA